MKVELVTMLEVQYNVDLISEFLSWVVGICIIYIK
jgi:hypothetical protein